jgi:hypothetical protein
MEGMNQNEVVYELALDVPWLSEPIDVPAWLDAWVARRYGLSAPRGTTEERALGLVRDAWRILQYVLPLSLIPGRRRV